MPETYQFQTEIKQLLDIVIHSLYTEKEIFVRELVSNASDALEKMRHLQITEKDIFEADQALEVNITTDDTAKTFTIQDSGLGMTREELVTNLGTIAHSGSKAFLQALAESERKDTSLIGQFGVGFYAAFMVAKQVRVYSRSWRAGDPGHLWSSDGSGSYTIEECEGLRRGCKIVVELKDDASEFSQSWRIEEILKRYSSFVPFPLNLNGTRINTVQAIWLRNKAEIKDEEYTEFYKFQANAHDEPLMRLHFSADAPLAINSLLFVPKENPEKYGLIRAEPSVALYCRKVLIDARPKDLLPEWLRFLKGVIDSEDLPLNISRETMQDRSLLDKLGKVITRRFLKFLDEEAKQRPDAYDTFWNTFGRYIKEGAATDFGHSDLLVKLLRFESSVTEAGKTTSLADYVSRLREGQKEIYFLVGPSRAAIEAGPYIEGFKARSIEVLYGYDPVDDYMMGHLHEFEGKRLLGADHPDVKLPDAPVPPAEEGDLDNATADALAAWLKETLGERVEAVQRSDRLTGSPALAVSTDRFTSPHMRRLLRAMKKDDGPEEPVKVRLEINPRHAVLKRLQALRTEKPEVAKLAAEQLLDNTLLAAGLLDDPSSMVARLNKLLSSV